MEELKTEDSNIEEEEKINIEDTVDQRAESVPTEAEEGKEPIEEVKTINSVEDHEQETGVEFQEGEQEEEDMKTEEQKEGKIS